MRIAIIGLGYVGLPLAIQTAKSYPQTIAYDVDPFRVDQLNAYCDQTGEVSSAELEASSLRFTAEAIDLQSADLFIIAVPTPIDVWKRPDLSPLMSATETVGRSIRPGAVVVYESTVYPGVTEDICGPILETCSGLKSGVGFKLGYSPERINPGDKLHSIDKITKVVSAQDESTLELLATVYGSVTTAGVHKAPSIKVAEMAKVIENTQRDVNIALMNEIAIICERIGIRTSEVLQASYTKWNFLRFTPGLVGGHCIGVDPYYLTTKAEELGYQPQVILSGRRLNDGMGQFIAQKLVKLLIEQSIQVNGAKVGILGISFKEDVSDVRNSKVVDIVRELERFGVDVLVHDPYADQVLSRHHYGTELVPIGMLRELDGLILAVAHKTFLSITGPEFCRLLKKDAVVIDVKSAFSEASFEGRRYWSL